MPALPVPVCWVELGSQARRIRVLVSAHPTETACCAPSHQRGAATDAMGTRGGRGLGVAGAWGGDGVQAALNWQPVHFFSCAPVPRSRATVEGGGAGEQGARGRGPREVLGGAPEHPAAPGGP